VNAAQLIGPLIERTPVQGYDWLVAVMTQHGFPGIASEIEIVKACYFLKRKEFDQAIEQLKRFEQKEMSLMARAATNLSFLYFLDRDFKQAEQYADVAVKADRYNSRALVNKANCLFVNAEFERAKEVYLESIGVSADCLEAIYNLGIVNIHLGRYQEAMLAFDKLHSITHHNVEVMWQLGDLHEKRGDLAKAHEWFSLVLTDPKGRPTDPGVLARIATLFSKQDDENQAFHYQLEAYRYWPVDINVITWLGIYHVKQEMYEQAVPYFTRAAEVQPMEAKWLLMVASCYRRMQNLPKALELYERIHREHPFDLEAVRYLVQICKEMQVPSEKSSKYQAALRKLERLQEQQEEDMGMGGDDQAEYGEFEHHGYGAFEHHSGFGMAPPPMRPVSHGASDGPAFEVLDDDVDAAPKPKRVLKAKARDEDEDLDWGNDELGDDLLPQ
jgi:intraflagellar transport protein 88